MVAALQGAAGDVRDSIRVPSGPHAKLILGVTRRGAPVEPSDAGDGSVRYQWKGLDGGLCGVRLRVAGHPEFCERDELAAAAIRRAASTDRSFLELLAILATILDCDGRVGVWRWKHALDILYGAKARPERHTPALRAIMALLERGWWTFELPGAGGGQHHRRSTAGQEHQLLEEADGQTVRLTNFARSTLNSTVALMSPATLRIADTWDPVEHRFVAHAPNPEGNQPSRSARARTRAYTAMTCASLRRGGPPTQISPTEIVVSSGGDIDRVAKRRHINKFGLAMLEEIKAAGDLVIDIVVAIRDDAKSVLRALVTMARRPMGPQSVPSAVPAPRGPPERPAS